MSLRFGSVGVADEELQDRYLNVAAGSRRVRFSRPRTQSEELPTERQSEIIAEHDARGGTGGTEIVDVVLAVGLGTGALEWVRRAVLGNRLERSFRGDSA